MSNAWFRQANISVLLHLGHQRGWILTEDDDIYCLTVRTTGRMIGVCFAGISGFMFQSYSGKMKRAAKCAIIYLIICLIKTSSSIGDWFILVFVPADYTNRKWEIAVKFPGFTLFENHCSPTTKRCGVHQRNYKEKILWWGKITDIKLWHWKESPALEGDAKGSCQGWNSNIKVVTEAKVTFSASVDYFISKRLYLKKGTCQV